MKQAVELDQLGIDYIGFNFWKEGKRYVDPQSLLPGILDLSQSKTVGIFVNAPISEIEEIADSLSLNMIQLHGQEDADYMGKLKEAVELPIIKAIPVFNEIPDLNAYSMVDQLLFDTASKNQFGGTGESFNWKLLADISPRNFFVAGGIGPQNIKQAVEQSRPFAVDLNSKVESKPGVKNLLLVKHCLTQLGIDFEED